ncbi:hypothetical protein NDU88_002661 [Pleurodeles waltl]|uniref:Uncharacterized protein n=1 Tax=Pleurodeles waltl TaxID=8319 RepID=A0AAV7MWE3_PLEWA|nr:hypothetical protein NDU88_002661 [Pleurodeles waltl]
MPRGYVLGPCRTGGTSGVGLADPEVLSWDEQDADTSGRAGPLNGPKQPRGGATMGTEIFLPGTNDEGWANRNADGDAISRLPCIGRGTQEAATR